MHCEFSLNHYRECIEKAKELGYEIRPVCDYPFLNEDYTKFILLRHDVDFSLQCALELALVEASLRVRSTYYVMLQSEFYNAITLENVKLIKSISELGHEIGYHVNTLSMLEDEELLLERITGKPVRSLTHHFPLISPKRKIKRHYLDAMSKDIQVKYISDSCRRWREGCMCKWIGKEDKLQILIHPEWWTIEGNNREEAIFNIEQVLVNDVWDSMQGFRNQIPEYLDGCKNGK